MTREEYLNQLWYGLRALPEADARDAVEYYESYLIDAGEDEAQAIAGLGAPDEVAAKILAEYAVKEPTPENNTPKRGLKVAWGVILAVFAAPVTLPIAIAVVAVAVSLLAVLLALLVSLGAVGAAAVVGSVAYIMIGFMSFSHGIGTVLMFIGCGLFMLGFGSLLLKAVVALSKPGIRAISKFVGKVILRRNTK